MNLKYLAFVRISEKYEEIYKSTLLRKDSRFIFLGEIHNMKGHCVIAGFDSGKVYSGWHTEIFELIPEELM